MDEIKEVTRPAAAPQEVPIDEPGGFTVMILNNPVTPFEVVVEALMHGAGLSEGEAVRRMLRAHLGGWAAVAAYGSKDVAETVASAIEAHARGNGGYEQYRPLSGHVGPWPLDAEVREAG
jgi:ATP-dependent Clp protease adapter protein ClpS